MTGRILVTPRSITAAGLAEVADLDPLRSAGYELVSGPAGVAPTLADLREIPSDIVGWLAGVERIGAEELDLFSDLRVISRNGAGADSIDAAAAATAGVEIALARGANARGVAELALSLMMAAIRGTFVSHENLRSGEWVRVQGREFPDLTVGVVGFGAIGRLVGGYARALGARVLVHDPFARIDRSEGEQLALDELLSRSDVVTLHTPAPTDGSYVMGSQHLRLLRRDAVLVNTARWSLVDPDAALTALESGRLAAYAIDAFNEEPPLPHPLLQHRRVILTAHLGGFTDASIRRATQAAVANLLTRLG